MTAKARAGVEYIEHVARAREESLLAAYDKAGHNLTDEVIREIMSQVDEICQTHCEALMHQMSEGIRRTFGSPPAGLEGALAGVVERGVSRIVSDIGRELAIRRDEAILDERRKVTLGAGRPASASEEKEWDVFICHASEDKDFVRPLAEALRAQGLKVWYDEVELKVGDSLREAIDRGLALSRYGVVVLSPNFFAKEWPQKELDGLVAKEVRREKVILPVWHEIGFEDVRRISPTLAGRVAAKASEGLDAVIDKLLRAVQASP